MAKNNSAIVIYNPNPNWEKDGESRCEHVSAWHALTHKKFYDGLSSYTWTDALRRGLAGGDIDRLYEQTIYRYTRRYGGELSRQQCKHFNTLWKKKHGEFHDFSGIGSRKIMDSARAYENKGVCIEWNFQQNEPYWFATWLHADWHTSIKNPESMARNECELTAELINQFKKDIEHEQRLSNKHRRTAQQTVSGNGAVTSETDGHGYSKGNGASRQFDQRIGSYRIFYLENGANAWENDGNTWQSEIGQGRKLEFIPTRDGSIVAISSPLLGANT
jgi:mRNA-degrading endonuclease RelE of RelBE toxin-antitoxin system